MTKYLILFATFLTAASSCRQSFDAYTHFSTNEAFDVEMGDTITKTMATFTVLPNTKKHEQLLRWLEANRDGWQKTSGSFSGDIMVRQGNFVLLRLDSGGVMISTTAKEGKPIQYRKDGTAKNLEFLKRR